MRRIPICVAIGALLCVCSSSLLADKVVLRIRVVNPADKPQPVQIKANLPARVSTTNIISAGGLDVDYDVKSGTYYVHKEIELGPHEPRIYDVEIDDIWVVPESELRAIVLRAGELAKLLEQTPEYHDTAVALQADVSRAVEQIKEQQAQNRIPAVTPIQHIRTYDANLKVLSLAKKDVGRIENLVLASGQDPGTLVGEALDVPPRRATNMAPEEYKTAVFRITVHNTSPDRNRKNVSIHRDLPEEIAPADVVDAGELEVGTDSKRNITYVFKDGIELAPNETKSFDVTIRDKWNVNPPRIAALRTRIESVMGEIGEGDQYQSVNDSLQELLNELGRIANEVGPEDLNAEYVAFYRDQAARLDEVEQSIHRLEVALRPAEIRQKRGFRIQPPSMKTTWLIIYIILGFLALISLLFFLRWMGKSKAEKSQEEEGG